MRVVGMSAGEGMQVFMIFDGVLTEMLTVKQAAYRYNFSFRTIQQWINEDKITPVTIEGRNWIKKSDIDSMLIR